MRVVKVRTTGSVAAPRLVAILLVGLTSLVAVRTSAQTDGTHASPHDLTTTSVARSTTVPPPRDLTSIAVARSITTFEPTRDLMPLLTEARVRARRWHRAWALTFAIGLVAQGVLVGLAADRDERLANLFGAIPPLTGLTIQLASPLASLREPPLDEAPELTLARYARSEAEKRNWFAHVGPIFLNLAVAAVQLFAFDRPLNAGLQVGLGITLSQTQLWTSPRVATNALR